MFQVKKDCDKSPYKEMYGNLDINKYLHCKTLLSYGNKCALAKHYVSWKKSFKYKLSVYVGVLISLWLFLFPVFQFATQPTFFLGWVKEVRTTKSQVYGAQGEYVA
jgi:hypothetical protein